VPAKVANAIGCVAMTMSDLICVAAIIGFFLASAFYVRGCAKL
jgi:hypothetical protein